jgi:bacterioferritin-associated ferredoxin
MDLTSNTFLDPDDPPWSVKRRATMSGEGNICGKCNNEKRQAVEFVSVKIPTPKADP